MARHGLRTIVERCAADGEITLDVVVEADPYATLKDLVRHGHRWTILPLAPIHQDVIARALTAAPLIDPVPVGRLVLSFAMNRPTTRLARFAGKAIVDIVADQVERPSGSGSSSKVKRATHRITRYLYILKCRCMESWLPRP